MENLPLDIKIPEVCQFFSTVGKIKVDRITKKPRVWVYHDKSSGEPTGECTITYNDKESQQLALQTYDGEKLRGMALRDGDSIKFGESSFLGLLHFGAAGS